MNKIIVCMGLFVIGACATEQSTQRPAATPESEPAPADIQGAEPDTKTTTVPPAEIEPTESEPAAHPTVNGAAE